MIRIIARGQICITDVYDGDSCYLTNEAVLVPSNADGSSPVLTGANTTALVLHGGIQVVPTIATLVVSGCTASASANLITINTVTADSGYVDIPISYGGVAFGSKRFSFSKSKQGAIGGNGKSYVLNVINGVRTIMYDASGVNPTPTQTAFSCELYENGILIATPTSWAWTSTGHLSGTSATATFTPVVNATFNATYNTTVSLTVTYAGQTIKQTESIATTKNLPTFITATQITGGRLQEVNGATVLTDIYKDANGGLITINDINGLLNATLGSESGAGANIGGTLKLYNDGVANSRVEMGIDKVNDAGIINLRGAGGNIRACLYGDGSVESTLNLFDASGVSKTYLRETSGVIDNDAIITSTDIDMSGSNANGWWVKLYDGTLLQYQHTTGTMSIATAYGQVFINATVWTFPVAFYDLNIVATPSDIRLGGGVVWGSIVSAPTVSQVSIRTVSATSLVSGTVSLGFMAIGRWKA